MLLHIIYRNGKPFEWSVDREVSWRLVDHGISIAKNVVASTNLEYVKAMLAVIPDVLDADNDMGLEIVTITL